jgi:hypothetical protein
MAVEPAVSEAAVLDWLLASDEPAVRHRALTELLDRAHDDREVIEARRAIPRGSLVSALLTGLQPGGDALSDPYRKFSGSHWRLVSLADLRFPAGDARLEPALDTELAWAMTRGTPARPVRGLHRNHASQEGNAVAAACRLGFGDDRRVPELVDRLAGWQWPDGGWNCDRSPEATHSSFHESLPPLRGLVEYRRASGRGDLDDVIAAAAEMFLRAGLFRTLERREVLHPSFLRLRYPPYWHYNVLAGLVVLTDAGLVGDPRASEALDVVEAKRMPDGRFRAEGAWWANLDGTRYPAAVAWGRSGPNEMVTLDALRVLRAAGRLGEAG